MKIIVCLLFFCLSAAFAQELQLVSSGFLFPEGPAWDGSQTLYVSNCYGDWVSRVSGQVNDTLIRKPTVPFDFGKTNGLTVYKNGDIYACDYGSGSILCITPSGSCSIYIAGYQGLRFNRPNDLAFDPSGNLYFTDPKSYGPDKRDGRLFMHLRKANQTILLTDTLAFPNGLAFTADGRHLFVCESALNRVIRFEVKKDGRLGTAETLIRLPGGDPDGIAVDHAGNLYVAHFGGGAVYHISGNGRLLREIKTPGRKPTNVEFGGPDMKTLYITEAETNSLYSLPVRIPGLKLFFSP